MLWQIVCDLPPWRLGADENVQPGTDHGIIVEQTGRDAHCRQVWGLAWRRRATDRAEGSKAPRSGFETSDQITTRQHPEFADVDVDEAGERRPGQLPAIDTMAMRERSSRLDLEADTATETRTPDHTKRPQHSGQQLWLRQQPLAVN
jgi:hypothetical protein